MKTRGFRCLTLICLGLTAFLATVPALHAAGDEIAVRGHQLEGKALEIETMFGQLLDSNHATPVFTEYGDGFYSLSIALRPEDRERLRAALAPGDTEKAPQTFFVLAAGQQLTAPSNPSTCIHAALSNTNLSYNYWVVVLNLGQSVTRTTTAKLNGPGKKFTKSFQTNYGGNAIWAVWYNPSSGVTTPGVYTFTATLAGNGSATVRSFAVRP
jgi:hypothetical protein